MQNKISSSMTIAAILLIIFALMFELNHLMPLHRDDYDYSMIWKTGEHLNSLSDIFQSTERHYFLHGGRMFTVFCLSLFLWIGKFAFDIANALMFSAMVVLIYLHARRDLKFDEPKIFAAAGLLTWLCLPHFGEVAVWKSGSTVYLWSAVPVALFLLPYNLIFAGTKKIGNSIVFAAGMFLLGVIAGCSVENLAVTVTLISVVTAFYFRKKNLLSAWMVAGSIGNILGLITLLAAPGNFVRYDEQSSDKGLLIHIGNQFAGNGEMLLYILPAVLILICVFSKSKRIGGEYLPVELLVIAGILMVSYFCDNFLARTFKAFCTEFIFQSFNPSEKFLDHFDNFIMKSEEFIIYALILFVIFLKIKSSIQYNQEIKIRDFPYSVFLFGLAIFNNFVMIAAPTFPARATFSSVVMILIGTLAILRNSAVNEKIFTGQTFSVIKLGAVALGAFTVISATVITANIRQENDLRISAISEAASKHQTVITFPPIEIKNRALRHVFFADFDNSVTKDGLCEFYGIKDIKVESPNKNKNFKKS